MHFYSPPGLGEPRAWKNRGVGTDFFSDTPWSHPLGLMVYCITAFKICPLETYLTLSPRMDTTSWHTPLIWVFEHMYLPFSLPCKKSLLIWCYLWDYHLIPWFIPWSLYTVVPHSFLEADHDAHSIFNYWEKLIANLMVILPGWAAPSTQQAGAFRLLRKQEHHPSQIPNQEFFTLPRVDCLVMKDVGLSNGELVRLGDTEFLHVAVSEVRPLHLVEMCSSGLPIFIWGQHLLR